MRELLIQALHVFVIIMIASFFIFGLMAINGGFDHWTTRLKQHTKHIWSRIRRFVFRNRRRKELHKVDEYQNLRHPLNYPEDGKTPKKFNFK